MLIAHRTKSGHFAFDSLHKIFACIASDLPRQFDFLAPVWVGASDRGFVLEHKEAEAIFSLSKSNYDDYGDLCSWRFDPISSSVLENPDIRGVSVLIFNS